MDTLFFAILSLLWWN